MYLTIGKKYTYRDSNYGAGSSELEDIILLSSSSEEELLEQMAYEQILFDKNTSREFDYKQPYCSLQWTGIVEVSRCLYDGERDMPSLENWEDDSEPKPKTWNTPEDLFRALQNTETFKKHEKAKEDQKRQKQIKEDLEYQKSIEAQDESERELYLKLKNKYEPEDMSNTLDLNSKF